MRKGLAVLLGALIAGVLVGSASAVPNFFQGFETDTANWNEWGGSTITRVPSGTDGITSAAGDYHATLGLGDLISGGAYNGKRYGPYTDWGGYENVFPADGYVTQVDVYLDMAEADGTDKRFDFSSAINQPSGDHRRDFIFAVGTVPEENYWAVSVSNNAPGWPNNPGRDPLTIDESGWYTFRSTFENDGSGVLQVTMEVLDSDGNSLASWVLSDPSDTIGTAVGGNRYGWFVTNDFDGLAIDNAEKYDIVPLVGPPTSKDECKKGGWTSFNNPEFKNQGDCVSFVASGK
jgi:hypothetical protein